MQCYRFNNNLERISANPFMKIKKAPTEGTFANTRKPSSKEKIKSSLQFDQEAKQCLIQSNTDDRQGIYDYICCCMFGNWTQMQAPQKPMARRYKVHRRSAKRVCSTWTSCTQMTDAASKLSSVELLRIRRLWKRQAPAMNTANMKS